MDKTHKTHMAPDEEKIRKYYTGQLNKMIGKNYSWTKMDDGIRQEKKPEKLIRWIVVALFLIPLKKFHTHYIALWYALQQKYPEELSLWKPEEKIRRTIEKIDPYVETLLEWTEKKLIPDYTLADYIKDLSQIWDTGYELEYFLREVKEMQEDRKQTGELTSFTKIKPRKKKTKNEGVEENQNV